MDQLDCCKRIERLLKNEALVDAVEYDCAKRSAKLFDKLDKLKQTVEARNTRLEVCKMQVEEIKAQNCILANIKAEEEEYLEKLKAELRIKKQNEEQIARENRKEMERMASLRDLKIRSNTYIDLNSLPERVRGVVLVKEKNGIELQQFDLDPTKVTKDEMKKNIWQECEKENIYQEAWLNIIYGTIAKAKAKVEAEAVDKELMKMIDLKIDTVSCSAIKM